MNEILEIIYNRRSIRNYKTQQISGDDIKAILKAACYAPSARNQQNWHFSVIQNPALLSKLKRILKENMRDFGPDAMRQRASDATFDPFFHAPTLVIISGDTNDKVVAISCGAAAQNLMLAAESLKISSCIMTSPNLLFQKDEDNTLKKELGFPKGYQFQCAITLGYREGEKPAAAPRKEDVITYL